jgi:hypothetical protein
MADKVFTGFYGHAGVREPPPPTDPPVNVDIPHVSGVGTVGEILTCTMGNWEGEPTDYAYLWESDGRDVGTDDGSYLIAATDAGHSITCTVTATNAWGSTTAPPSNAVAVAARRKTGGGKDG